jgi:hypothetical protein
LFYKHIEEFRDNSRLLPTPPKPTLIQTLDKIGYMPPHDITFDTKTNDLLDGNGNTMINETTNATTGVAMTTTMTRMKKSKRITREQAQRYLLKSLIEANAIYAHYVDIGAPNELDITPAMRISIRSTLDGVAIRAATANNLHIMGPRGKSTTSVPSPPTLAGLGNEVEEMVPRALVAAAKPMELLVHHGVTVSTGLSIDMARALEHEIRFELFTECQQRVIDALDGRCFQRFIASDMYTKWITWLRDGGAITPANALATAPSTPPLIVLSNSDNDIESREEVEENNGSSEEGHGDNKENFNNNSGISLDDEKSGPVMDPLSSVPNAAFPVNIDPLPQQTQHQSSRHVLAGGVVLPPLRHSHWTSNSSHHQLTSPILVPLAFGPMSSRSNDNSNSSRNHASIGSARSRNAAGSPQSGNLGLFPSAAPPPAGSPYTQSSLQSPDL